MHNFVNVFVLTDYSDSAIFFVYVLLLNVICFTDLHDFWDQKSNKT